MPPLDARTDPPVRGNSYPFMSVTFPPASCRDKNRIQIWNDNQSAMIHVLGLIFRMNQPQTYKAQDFTLPTKDGFH